MRKFIDKVLDFGSRRGFSAGEVYYSSSKSLDLKVFRGEIEKYDTSETGGLSFRGILNGRMGYSYSELVDDSVVEELVNSAYDSAVAVESEDEVFIFGEECSYVDTDNYDPALAQIPIQKKIALVKELEQKIRSADERVLDVHYCTYSEHETKTVLCNTMGKDLSDHRNYALVYAMVSLKDGDAVRTNFDGVVVKKFENINIDAIAKSILDGAIAQIGAKSIKSRNTKVLLDRKAFAALLQVHIDVFSADQVQKGLSPMKGKIGEVVGVSALNIMDDPHRADSVMCASFDGEGYPTSRKHLIENGVLKTFMHNLKTAKKDGVESTGNASRGSYKSSVEVGPNCIVVEGGSHSYEELVRKCGEGVIITELNGLHAGCNPVSGEFSLMASGFEIKDGERSAPITQVVISGNFYKLLEDIEEFGSDVSCELQTVGIFAPSVIIRELTLSGE